MKLILVCADLQAFLLVLLLKRVMFMQSALSHGRLEERVFIVYLSIEETWVDNSENHAIVQFGRDQSPQAGSTRAACPVPSSAGFEYFQKWRHHNLSGKPAVIWPPSLLTVLCIQLNNCRRFGVFFVFTISCCLRAPLKRIYFHLLYSPWPDKCTQWQAYPGPSLLQVEQSQLFSLICMPEVAVCLSYLWP